MERKIVITADGSSTIYLPAWNEQYHSKHGALGEAYHVFINSGLHHLLKNQDLKPISILEIGFGTGLNAFITLLEAETLKIAVNYHGVEAYPVSTAEIKQLNYASELKTSDMFFYKMHDVLWDEHHKVTNYFSIIKRKQFFADITDKESFNLIYFDAFGARVQPELWTEDVFKKMFDALKPQGVLVTYAAKGSVRRAMLSVGFKVEKLPGPPGKREMLRATKCY